MSRPDDRPRLLRLRQAAEQAFAERGIAAATVPDIAARAGVSVGLLYRYFPSKADLAVAIVEADRDNTRDAVARLVADTDDPWTVLATLVRGSIDLAVQDRTACALIPEIGATATRDDRIRAVTSAAQRDIAAQVASVVARACPALDADATAMLLLTALDGLASQVAIDPDFDPTPAAEQLLSLLAPHRNHGG